jgi:hypothetical protein
MASVLILVAKILTDIKILVAVNSAHKCPIHFWSFVEKKVEANFLSIKNEYIRDN